MGIARWLLGIVMMAVLVIGTGQCSRLAHDFMRQMAVDLGETRDPAEMLGCVIGGRESCGEGVGGEASVGGSAPILMMTPLVSPAPTVMGEGPRATVRPTRGVVVREATAVPTVAVAATVVGGSGVELPRIRDPRQIRILLLGIDQRSADDEQGPYRTDTMILMNVDPARKTVGVLSLPRDLWVEIPGFESNRINTANAIGDSSAYPGGGGPALAMETVAVNFGVKVEKYILINFDVFTSVVDLLAPNGVPIVVTEAIDDPHYPDAGFGTIHVRFAPGMQRLDAERLLQYARTRATEGGDFDRARRQQEVLDAVRAEVLSAGGLFNLIARAGELWVKLSENYRTNLGLDEILALGGLMGEIEREDIRYEVVNNFYVSDGLSPSGDYVLYPDYAAISGLIQRTFYPQAGVSLEEVKARAEAEGASIHVFNGTQLNGLARATGEWLAARGVLVASIDNLNGGELALTELRDYGGNHHWTARYIAGLMGISEERIVRAGDGLIAEGVMVALGRDALGIIDGG